jgi:hypothetical protein
MIQIVDGPTIPQGESLSDGADVSAGDIVRITVPQEYTAANLTFQISSDGNFYNDLFLANGDEVTVAAKESSGIIIRDVWVKSINFIKFRSGTRDHPVVQRETCRFAIAIETADAPAGMSRKLPNG